MTRGVYVFIRHTAQNMLCESKPKHHIVAFRKDESLYEKRNVENEPYYSL